MTVFPCAKINLGLNIIERRPDGYHNLETVFYPIPLYDALEVHPMDHEFPSDQPCDIKVTGIPVSGQDDENLVVRAYQLIASDFELPRLHIHLHKRIPTQAGLGGGSSDAAYMIRLLDERFHLNMGNAEMERYAARLGADCAFFITSETAFAQGIGDILEPADGEYEGLEGYWLVLVKPDIAVSTREAFSRIKPCKPAKSCRMIVRQPISTWKDELTNDFEQSIFELYPAIGEIKQSLYKHGAVFAQMSGSGSCVYGIFRSKPVEMSPLYPQCQTYTIQL